MVPRLSLCLSLLLALLSLALLPAAGGRDARPLAQPQLRSVAALADDVPLGGVQEETPSLPPPPFLGPPVPTPAAPTPAPSPTPAVASTAGWRLYSNAAEGYRVRYPQSWLTRFEAGSTPALRYFASADVQAPLEMTPNAVWLSVEVTPQSARCGRPPAGVVSATHQVALGGLPSTAYEVDPAPGSVEPTWKLSVAAAHGKSCYELLFVTLRQPVRQAQLPTLLGIVSGFQFG